MQPGHMEYCASDDWRRLVHETILPVALKRVTLGDAAIEIGPGPGFTTDILRTKTAHLAAVELDEGLAAGLAERMAGTNVEVVVGDATALDFEAERFTGRGLRSTCSITLLRPKHRTGCSPSWPGCWFPRRHWWRRTASTARAVRPSTKTTPTTPSTRWSWSPGSRAAGFGSVRVRTSSSAGCARLD